MRQQQAKLAALQDGRPGHARGRSGSGYRYAVTYRHDGYGQLDEITNAGGDFVWKAESRDAFGPASRLTLGHGFITDEILDLFARGTSMTSSVPGARCPGPPGSEYGWSAVGILDSRTDSRSGILTETLTGDSLDCLLAGTVGG